MLENKKIARFLRWFILGLILVYVTYEAYLHQALGGEKAASAHALCPFGGLESLYSILFAGTYIQKIFIGTMIIFGLTVLISILFRRSFCGLLCPFGALQELFAKIGQKVLGKRYNMPAKIDRPLRYLKYVILVITVVFAWVTKGLWMSPYDPYVAYGHIGEGLSGLYEEFLIGTILLIVTIIGSFIYDRFFCKYLCPAGAFYAIIGKISPNKVVRNNDICIHCNACSKVCPVNIDVEKIDKVTTAECINCNECVNVCPKKGAIEIKEGNKSMSPLIVSIIVIAIFFGGIFISQVTGIYKSTPTPLKQGETLTVEKIRGYMTLEDVAKGLNIEIKDLYVKLGIPEAVPPSTKFKEVSKYVPGFTDEKAKEILEQ